ncbi:hypothetical protein E5676_scaffold124G00100 [Cucumis melo var. makuwa]|uniref:Ty3-gypsy retrotransposon protein n=1 Tax=Cucumis melo var. makuwa TaxID=1194695 RepID=A0A5D3DSN6_CUCMM|nr:hypothetical protein E5676_scaffold124G00100 [Cucumis melo var. makuwa]
MATKEEENQCPTSTSAQTSAFKRLSISTLKKDRPSTSTFDHLKMISDRHEREMKTLKAKLSYEENNDDGKIHSRVPSCMKRKLSFDINTEEPKLHGAPSPQELKSAKISSRLIQMLLHQLQGLHCYFSMSKFEGFIDASSYSSSKASSTLPHIQARRREDLHLQYVVAEKVVISSML